MKISISWDAHAKVGEQTYTFNILFTRLNMMNYSRPGATMTVGQNACQATRSPRPHVCALWWWWQVTAVTWSLKESVNNIRGWLRDALSKSNLSADHNKKHRANSINHSSTFAYFFSVCQFILYFIYIDNLSYRYHINYTISLTAT